MIPMISQGWVLSMVAFEFYRILKEKTGILFRDILQDTISIMPIFGLMFLYFSKAF